MKSNDVLINLGRLFISLSFTSRLRRSICPHCSVRLHFSEIVLEFLPDLTQIEFLPTLNIHSAGGVNLPPRSPEVAASPPAATQS